MNLKSLPFKLNLFLAALIFTFFVGVISVLPLQQSLPISLVMGGVLAVLLAGEYVK